MTKTTILVVDDEPDVVQLIDYNLRGSGYEVITAVDGEEALIKARSATPDLIILDLMLPKVEGLEVCKVLRRESNATPIVMLTAKTSETDRVLGFELGADDYVTKPFSPRELILRVKRLLQTARAKSDEGERLQLGDLVIDVARHEATIDGKPLELTATEFKLLTVLVRRRGRVQSREQLLRDVWEYDTRIDTRTVDTHMRRLREKLGSAAKYIHTVRGFGYRSASE
jgi:DNA-binding response OmpR family regulator